MGAASFSPVGLGLSAVGVGADVYNYFQADAAQKRIQRQIDALNGQPLPRYNIDPAISRYYRTQGTIAANPHGFTQGEANAFDSRVARTINTGRYNATNDAGGNLGKAIGAMGVASELGAVNDFAGQDAGILRNQQNLAYARQYQAANQFQDVANRNNQMLINRRLMMDQGYGRALQSQKDYKRNLLGGAANDLISGGLALAGGYDGGGSPDVTPAPYSVSNSYLRTNPLVNNRRTANSLRNYQF